MNPNLILASYDIGPTYVRNASCWVGPKYNFDLTGYAFGIEGVGTTGGGCLISRRHIISAAHVIGATGYSPNLPKKIWFTNNDNVTFEYTIVTVTTVLADDPGYSTDLCVGLLNTDVDASITHYKVLPTNWVDYLSAPIRTNSANTSNTISCFYSNQFRTIGVGDLYYTPTYNNWQLASSFNAEKQKQSLAGIVGDSGNPIFCAIYDELVLLGAWYTGTTAPPSTSIPIVSGQEIGMFPGITRWYTKINEIMLAMSGAGYQLTPINLSSYAEDTDELKDVINNYVLGTLKGNVGITATLKYTTEFVSVTSAANAYTYTIHESITDNDPPVCSTCSTSGSLSCNDLIEKIGYAVANPGTMPDGITLRDGSSIRPYKTTLIL